MEQGLEEQLKCLLTAVDLAPVGIMQLELDGRIVRANPGFGAMVGRSAAELAGGVAGEWVVDDDRESFLACVRAAAAGSRSEQQCEIRLRRSGGEPLWAGARITAVTDSRGCPADLVMVVEDISGRKQLEAALEGTSLELKTIADAVPGVVCLVEGDGTFRRWNASYRVRLGYTDAEMAELKALDTVAPEDRDRISGKMAETLSAGRSESEFQAITKDGQRVPYVASAARVRGDDGTPLIAGIGIEMSALHAAREELYESQSRLRALLDATDEVALLMKPDGTLLEGNEALAAAQRSSSRRALSDNIFEMMEPPEAAARRARVAQVVEDGKVARFSDVEVDGTVRETVAYPVRSRGGAVETIAVFSRDVTQQRKLSERLRALTARQVAVREEERTRIAHEIHDELGQQLTVMKFDISRLRLRAATLPAGERREIEEQIASLEGFLDVAIQTVRRISTELRPSVLDHFGLVAALETLATEFEERTDIRCRRRFTEAVELPESLSTTIFRICQEALTNVARHSGATTVEISLEQDGPEITFRVEDNGRGATKDDLVPSKSLGLLSMEERARMSNGTVDVEGEPGKGTRVLARFKTATPLPFPDAGREQD